MSSDSLPARVDEPSNLRKEYETRLAAISPQQAEWVRHFLASGDARGAAELALYSRPESEVRRLRGSAPVMAAVRAGVALRETAGELTRDGALGFLEKALATTLEQLFVLNDHGQPIAVRDFGTLSAAQQRAVKSLKATVHKSAKGERAHLVKLDCEFYSAIEIINTIARLRGWTADSPYVSLHVESMKDMYAGVRCPPLVEELADAVLGDDELAEWVEANDRRKVEMIRFGIVRLRAMHGRA